MTETPEIPEDGYGLVERFWAAAWPTLADCENECGTCKRCVTHWAVTWSLAALSNPALVEKAEQSGAWKWTTESSESSEPTFTASEVKELTTKATAVALALGRKEALEQAEAAANKIAEECNEKATAHRQLSIDKGGSKSRGGASHMQTALAFGNQAAAAWAVAEAVREVASQPSQPVSNGLTATHGHSDLPPTPECRGCGQDGTGLENHNRDCPRNPLADLPEGRDQ